ncbi:hypothetical protein CYMTET_24786 [Cymbomonas tetramitiformis]|uniref:Ubiquitin-like domain-containing protein n=1 Tax=Cymbomonas tetramitiformis TaxID=36881 RepID=A0AAE0KZW3_9CHLO|nr:hypothetical protein CYMTET_24786 [Cymbomonas tetramitiformis]
MPPVACDPQLMAGGEFVLKVKVVSRGGHELKEIKVKGTDLVSEVKERVEPTFESKLRFAGTFDEFPDDLSLVDVGVVGEPEGLSCFSRRGINQEL